ncbi:hypothetical protein AAMO2058_000143400 [Amorphochlora amoebiformis]
MAVALAFGRGLRVGRQRCCGTGIRFTSTSRRILFCSEDFPAGPRLLEDALSRKGLADMWTISTCHHTKVDNHLEGCDVCVPLMAIIDQDRIERASASGLKVIYQYGAGLDGVDFDAARSCGVVVANIPAGGSGNGASTAEHALFLLLGLLRKYHKSQDILLSRTLGLPLGETLMGKTIGILGFGSIGTELAKRLQACGARVVGIRRGEWNSGNSAFTDVKANFRPKQQKKNLKKESDFELEDVMGTMDALVVACPLNPETRSLVNEDLLALGKEGLLLVNVARGGIVCLDSVTKGLKSGLLGGFGTDVFWQEPFPLPEEDPDKHQGGVGPLLSLQNIGYNILLTPHVGGVTRLSYGHMAKTMADRLEAFFSPASVSDNDMSGWGWEEGDGCVVSATKRDRGLCHTQ